MKKSATQSNFFCYFTTKVIFTPTCRSFNFTVYLVSISCHSVAECLFFLHDISIWWLLTDVYCLSCFLWWFWSGLKWRGLNISKAVESHSCISCLSFPSLLWCCSCDATQKIWLVQTVKYHHHHFSLVTQLLIFWTDDGAQRVFCIGKFWKIASHATMSGGEIKKTFTCTVRKPSGSLGCVTL